MNFPVPILFRIAAIPFTDMASLAQLPREVETLTELEFDERYRATIADLKQLAQIPELQNGLLLTSHSLLARVQSFIDKSPDILRKKEKQTARTLWQLLSRVGGKVSPFSSFTHVGILPGEEMAIASKNATWISSFRVNQLLLGQLLDLLYHYPPFYQKQKIRINPTVTAQADQLEFLLNTRNIESLQELTASPVIIWLLEYFKKEKAVIFEELLEDILENVEAERVALQDYLYQLMDYGFLVWEATISSDNWLADLRNQIAMIPDPDLCADLLGLLDRLDKSKKQFTKEGLDQKQQQHAFTATQQFWKKHQEHIPKAKVDISEEDGFKKIASEDLVLKVENLFFEDTVLPIRVYLKKERFIPLLKIVDELIPYLKADERPSPVLIFFKKHFSSDQSVPLWEVYRKWLRGKPDADALIASPTYKQSETLWTQFFGTDLSNKGMDLNLRLPATAVLKPTRDTVRSGLFQLFYQKGNDQLFLDTLLSDTSRLTSRFISLFPPTVQSHWQDFYQKQHHWMENTDHSFFNANVHPPLLSVRFQSPGSWLKDEAQTVAITDLSMGQDNDQIQLYYRGHSVRLVNLGAEAVNNRSGLFQFLEQLEPAVPNKRGLLDWINGQFSPTPEGLIQYPKIRFQDQVILQRTTWYFPIHLLPKKNIRDSGLFRWKSVMLWKNKHGLPDRVYYTLRAREIDHSSETKNPVPQLVSGTPNRFKADDYKPQLLDFYNAIAVDLFWRQISRVAFYLKITAILPDETDLIPMNGQPRMVEGVVSWED